MAKRIKATQARADFSAVINEARYAKERFVLTRQNRPVAAVVPIEDLDLIEHLENEIDIREADRVLADARRRGTRTIPWAEVKRSLKLK